MNGPRDPKCAAACVLTTEAAQVDDVAGFIAKVERLPNCEERCWLHYARSGQLKADRARLDQEQQRCRWRPQHAGCATHGHEPEEDKP